MWAIRRIMTDSDMHPQWWTGNSIGGVPLCDAAEAKAFVWRTDGDAIDALSEMDEKQRDKFCIARATKTMIAAAEPRWAGKPA